MNKLAWLLLRILLLGCCFQSSLCVRLAKKNAIMGHCKICILVLETLRSNYPYTPSTICQNLLAMEKNDADFEICEEVVAVLSEYGASVSLWQTQGCFRTEEYGAVEQLTPCPAHVICSQMETLRDFFIKSDYSSTDKNERHNLRALQIRPKPAYAAKSELDEAPSKHASIQTFCPPPLPQYVRVFLSLANVVSSSL